MAKSYPIVDLIDMAAIPEDRFAAFLAELPAIMSHIRQVVAFQKLMFEQAGVPFSKDDLLKVIASGEWTDDEKGNVNVSIDVCVKDADAPFASAKFHENLKTGERSFSASGSNREAE